MGSPSRPTAGAASAVTVGQFVCLIVFTITDELQYSETNKHGVIMKYNHTIQKILASKHIDKFKDAVNKSTFLANYAKEKDKVKKIEMLRKASQEGWI